MSSTENQTDRDISSNLGGASSDTQNVSFECATLVFDIEPNDGEPRYNAVVEVKNTGDTAINLGYTAFEIEDSDGNVVALEDSSAIGSQPSVVAPGEVGYYYAARIELPADFDLNADYTLKYDTDNISAVNANDIVDCEISDVSFPDSNYTEVTGRVINNTDKYLEAVDVVIICYDNKGDVVTVGGTIVEVEANSEQDFDILNYAAWGRTDITDYKIIAREIIY